MLTGENLFGESKSGEKENVFPPAFVDPVQEVSVKRHG